MRPRSRGAINGRYVPQIFVLTYIIRPIMFASVRLDIATAVTKRAQEHADDTGDENPVAYPLCHLVPALPSHLYSASAHRESPPLAPSGVDPRTASSCPQDILRDRMAASAGRSPGGNHGA